MTCGVGSPAPQVPGVRGGRRAKIVVCSSSLFARRRSHFAQFARAAPLDTAIDLQH
jgi:hypothetical protein